MKRFLLFGLKALFLLFATINFSCNRNRQKGEAEFYYYPKTNVYYDVSKKTYIYSLDGGKTWGNIITSTNKEPVTLGKHVVLYSSADSVWRENETHRKLYGGELYNIINDDGNTGPVVTAVSERKVVRKNSKAGFHRRRWDRAEKKPFRQFFQKIFGKHRNR